MASDPTDLTTTPCDVCGAWGASIRPVASLTSPLCRRCFIHWYTGALGRAVASTSTVTRHPYWTAQLEAPCPTT